VSGGGGDLTWTGRRRQAPRDEIAPFRRPCPQGGAAQAGSPWK